MIRPPPAFLVRLLGPPTVEDAADGRVLQSILAQPKRVALLAYLAAAGDAGRSRASLLATFWPDTPEERGRRSLNQAVYVLRRALGSDAVATEDDGTVRVDTGRVAVDLEAFEEALDGGRIDRALELYRGSFLEGLEIDASAAFDRWVDEERRRWRGAAVNAARRLADEAAGGGRLVEAAHRLRWARSLAPYDESLVLGLVRVLGAAGERAQAVQEAEEFAARLAQDLELEPSTELQAEVDRARTPPPSPEPLEAPGAGARAAPPEPFPPLPLERPRRAMLVPAWIAAGMAGLALAVFGFVRLVPPATAVRPPPDDARVVGVLAVDNRTGEPELDALARSATERVADAVAAAGLFHVTYPHRGVGSGTVSASGLMVDGVVYSAGPGAVVTARILDGPTGRLLRTIDDVPVDARAPLAALDTLGDRVAAAAAFLSDDRIRSWSHATTPPSSLAAYLAFSEGLTLLYAGERAAAEAAVERFRTASALDPAFAAASAWEGMSRAFGGSIGTPEGTALVARLEARLADMDPWSAAASEFVVAAYHRQWRRKHEAISRVARITPHPLWLLDQAQTALWVQRPREVLDLLTRIPWDTPTTTPWPNRYWFIYCGWGLPAASWIGDFESLLEIGRRCRLDGPEASRAFARWGEIAALYALGREEEARAALGEVLRDRRAEVANPLSLPAGALERFGHADFAQELRIRAVETYRGVAPTQPGDPDAVDWAEVLYDAGLLDEARAAYRLGDGTEELCVRCAVGLGIVAAQTGDRAEALRQWDRLAHVPNAPGTFDALNKLKLAAWVLPLDEAMAMFEERWTHPSSQRTGAADTERHWEPLRAHPRFAQMVGPKG